MECLRASELSATASVQSLSLPAMTRWSRLAWWKAVQGLFASPLMCKVTRAAARKRFGLVLDDTTLDTCINCFDDLPRDWMARSTCGPHEEKVCMFCATVSKSNQCLLCSDFSSRPLVPQAIYDELEKQIYAAEPEFRVPSQPKILPRSATVAGAELQYYVGKKCDETPLWTDCIVVERYNCVAQVVPQAAPTSSPIRVLARDDVLRERGPEGEETASLRDVLDVKNTKASLSPFLRFVVADIPTYVHVDTNSAGENVIRVTGAEEDPEDTPPIEDKDELAANLAAAGLVPALYPVMTNRCSLCPLPNPRISGRCATCQKVMCAKCMNPVFASCLTCLSSLRDELKEDTDGVPVQLRMALRFAGAATARI